MWLCVGGWGPRTGDEALVVDRVQRRALGDPGRGDAGRPDTCFSEGLWSTFGHSSGIWAPKFTTKYWSCVNDRNCPVKFGAQLPDECSTVDQSAAAVGTIHRGCSCGSTSR